MLSLKLLAEQIGVSTATISNALNNKGKISPDLRRKIIELAKKSGYEISPHALALQGKRLNILGLMMTSIEDGMAQKFFLGADRAGQEKDFSTILSVTSHLGQDTLEMELRSVRRFDILRIGGVLYVPAANTEHFKVEKFLRDRDIPFVLLYRRLKADKSPAVVVDHALGVQLGLDHLIALGHKRIGIVYSRYYRGPEVDIARAVFQKKLPQLPWETWNLDNPDDVERLLKRRATAFLALSDQQAWQMAEKLKQLGLSVPGDISLVGFRDTLVAQSMTPKLTTIHVPAEEMGHAAAQWLVKRIEWVNSRSGENDEEPEPIDLCMPPSLLVRESTAPPRRSAK